MKGNIKPKFKWNFPTSAPENIGLKTMDRYYREKEQGQYIIDKYRQILKKLNEGGGNEI